MVGKEDIYRMLREEEIWHEITEHPAVYNMEEMAQIKLPYPEASAGAGSHIENASPLFHSGNYLCD